MMCVPRDGLCGFISHARPSLSLSLPADQDVKLSASIPGSCLSVSIYDDHGLNL